MEQVTRHVKLQQLLLISILASTILSTSNTTGAIAMTRLSTAPVVQVVHPRCVTEHEKR